ncbi:MAG: DUF2029 domain-containing protein, partial [Actinobacteria bacterium]
MVPRAELGNFAMPTSPLSPTLPSAESRTRRREFTRLVFVVVALTVFLRLPAFFVEVFNSDETFLATQAAVINHGGTLYKDAADRKPPLVPYIYAATFSVFGTDELWTVRVVAMGAAALTALLLAAEARRRYGRRAMWMAAILCSVSLVAFAPQDGQAANFEIFMLPTMTAAVLLARRGRGFGAGVAVAAATMAKQTGVAALIPVFYLLARRQGRKGVSDAAMGFAIPTALVAIAVGPGQLLYWTVLGNGSYVDLHTASGYVLGKLSLMTLTWAACNVPILWRLPQAWRERRVHPRDGGSDTDLWLWALSGVLAVAVGLRFFGHYYMQLVPPLCLLSAGALSRGGRRIAIGTMAFAAVAAFAFSAAGYFMKPFGHPVPYASVSRYLDVNARPTDRILVWGATPEIYWASGLEPATRFLATPSFLGETH